MALFKAGIEMKDPALNSNVTFACLLLLDNVISTGWPDSSAQGINHGNIPLKSTSLNAPSFLTEFLGQGIEFGD